MSAAVRLAFDAESLKRDFPALQQQVRGKPLVYLDNAATTQRPQIVIDAVSDFYKRDNANVHRGVHALAERATLAYEAARKEVQQFLRAADVREIVFTRGATEAINLVANTWGTANVHKGDNIVITTLEHHSNIVPWQMLCERSGAELRVVKINDAGELDQTHYEQLLDKRTKLVAVGYVSNAIGTINPVKAMNAKAHAVGALVLVDGAQAVPHLRLDVRDLDCDFFAFSGHKVYAPTGIGALYAKLALLEGMPPWQGGGDMIASVTFEKTTYAPPPARFEAGTPHISGAIGLAAALRYVQKIGIEEIAAHEHALLTTATERLQNISGVRLIGTARDKAAVISFAIEGAHPHDIATILDRQGVAVRAGHHCAEPLMRRLSVPATARATFALYNTNSDIDALVAGIQKVKEIFS